VAGRSPSSGQQSNGNPQAPPGRQRNRPGRQGRQLCLPEERHPAGQHRELLPDPRRAGPLGQRHRRCGRGRLVFEFLQARKRSQAVLHVAARRSPHELRDLRQHPEAGLRHQEEKARQAGSQKEEVKLLCC
uniref:ANK_REP_REGION domain-containing protein n=1 Tax=Macrostomum lignano TaxID=282301 RepID=A0A1I8FMR8_9PLAT